MQQLTLFTFIHRPTDDEEFKRVPPNELPDYRNSHMLENPYCLCLLFGGSSKEVAIFIEIAGAYSGEYVARCAKNECGYFG
jgi:hypothetical protein